MLCFESQCPVNWQPCKTQTNSGSLIVLHVKFIKESVKQNLSSLHDCILSASHDLILNSILYWAIPENIRTIPQVASKFYPPPLPSEIPKCSTPPPPMPSEFHFRKPPSPSEIVLRNSLFDSLTQMREFFFFPRPQFS